MAAPKEGLAASSAPRDLQSTDHLGPHAEELAQLSDVQFLVEGEPLAEPLLTQARREGQRVPTVRKS